MTATPPHLNGLSDSHILKPESSSIFDGVELGEADAHDLRPGLSVVAGPAAESGDHPGGEGQAAFGVRIALSFGLAFETRRDGLEDGPVLRIEGIDQTLVGGAVAGLHELLDGDGGDRCGSDQVDHRLRLADVGGLDVEAGSLERAEELLDGPALTIQIDDAPRL